MISTRAGVVEPNNVQYGPAAVARSTGRPTSRQPRTSSQRPCPPRVYTGKVTPQVCRRVLPWLCILVVVATVAIALQLAAEAIPTTLASATVPISTDHAGRDIDAPAQGSVKTVLSPTIAPDASIGASLLRQCDVGTRVPSEVLVSMTKEELLYLEDILCPMDPSGSTN
jgi:hypothetical protein